MVFEERRSVSVSAFVVEVRIRLVDPRLDGRRCGAAQQTVDHCVERSGLQMEVVSISPHVSRRDTNADGERRAW